MADVLLIEDKVDSKIGNTDSCNPGEQEGTEMTQKQEEGEAVPLPCVENIVFDSYMMPMTRVHLEDQQKNDFVFRQDAARSLLDNFRAVVDNSENFSPHVIVLSSLAEDYEANVRIEVIQQVAPLAAFFEEYYFQVGHLTQLCLVPIIKKYLTDTNNQIRKITQASLLQMVEQKLLDMDSLENNICPHILELTEPTYMDDLRNEAVMLISKLAPLVGKDVTERVFLDRFLTLCLDDSFPVRKVCAENFGDICVVVEQETTEKLLLPKFYFLCKDSLWGVRKVCTEVFMAVSCVCSMDTRHKDLAPVYTNLLCDQSKWVRIAAFQALGPFISTFAEPSKTGLYYDKGVLTVVDVPAAEPGTYSAEVVKCENASSPTREQSVDCSDSVVPSNASEINNSYNIQSTMCHLGNYRTVIELSSSSPTDDKDSSAAILSNKLSKYRKYCKDLNSESLLYVEALDDMDSNFNDEFGKPQNCAPSKLPLECDSFTHSSLGEVKVLNTEVCNGEVTDSVLASDLTSYFESHLSNICKSSISNSNFGSIIVVGKSVPNDVTANRFVEDPSVSDTEKKLPSTSTISNVEVPPTYINQVSNSEDFTLSSSTGPSDEDEISCDEWTCDYKNSTLSFTDLPIELNITDSEQLLERKAAEKDSSQLQESLKEDGQLSKVSETAECPEVCDKLRVLDVVDKTIEAPESAFNYFQYWRTPLPPLDDSLIAKEAKLLADAPSDSEQPFISKMYSWYQSPSEATLPAVRRVKRFERSKCNMNSEPCSGDACDFSLTRNCQGSQDDGTSFSDVQSAMLKDAQTEAGRTDETNASMNNLFAQEQDIVPPQLLSLYLSMTDLASAQSVDAEIARHCAYSLPAVALTLGRRFWPCLKGTYNTLASDMQGFIMQWKVRRTLASSMHQVAVILGPEIAARDLLPIFSGFIKDLDEVRIGILQHLAEFLSVFEVKERQKYLPRLSDFLNSDNDRNWRFRHILAEQLIQVAELYEPSDIREYLVPLTLVLIQDKVSEVRLAAVRVMAVLIKRMSEDQSMTKEVLSELAEQFTHASKWMHRQIYVYFCQELVKQNSLPSDQFAEDALPHLLYLCWDRVPNVRLAIARCLAVVIWPIPMFSDPSSPHRELLLHAIHPLQSDVDPDVRYYANMVSTHECSCLQHSLADLDDQAV